MRAEVIRVLHRATLGMPTLTTEDLAGQRLTPAEQRCIDSAGKEDLALLNALLTIEREHRETQFAALERLLHLCTFYDGSLDERVYALPDRAFACAASELYALGWVNPQEGGTR